MEKAIYVWVESCTMSLVCLAKYKINGSWFCSIKDETSLFYYKKNGTMNFLLIYVDDIIVARSSKKATQDLFKN
jgi:hypothetical protein